MLVESVVTVAGGSLAVRLLLVLTTLLGEWLCRWVSSDHSRPSGVLERRWMLPRTRIASERAGLQLRLICE